MSRQTSDCPGRHAVLVALLTVTASLSSACVPRLAAQAAPAPALPAWLRPAASSRPPGPTELRIRWLGTAGIELRSARAAVVFDPFFSRTPLMSLLSGPARPDTEAIARHSEPVQAVFVGHAHYDHMLDAPSVAKRWGARLWASNAALRIAAAEGLAPDRQGALSPGMRVQVGDFTVEAVASRHAPLPTQWLAGGMLGPAPRVPMGFLDYKNDEVYGFLIRWQGRSLYHCGSADLDEAVMRDLRADLVFACVSGWQSNPAVFGRLYRALRPTVMAPMHHDDFFRPFKEGVIENPLAAYEDALRTIRRDAPTAAVLNLAFFDDHRLEAAP